MTVLRYLNGIILAVSYLEHRSHLHQRHRSLSTYAKFLVLLHLLRMAATFSRSCCCKSGDKFGVSTLLPFALALAIPAFNLSPILCTSALPSAPTARAATGTLFSLIAAYKASIEFTG